MPEKEKSVYHDILKRLRAKHGKRVVTLAEPRGVDVDGMLKAESPEKKTWEEPEERPVLEFEHWLITNT